eukprot:TRINITY_DN9793_c0_g1_i1.p1 TRINITY_DN9793_c0_g1~~TRINITY_DN9793_c0_g1_i1.p1  ORF type:complete len:249 (+),score=44.20 TRINITY_DN9793_c0_g1_i1:17-763(+)
MESVPKDILVIIVGFVDWKTILKTLVLVNKGLHSLLEKDLLWLNMIEKRNGSGARFSDRNKSWRSLFISLHPHNWKWIYPFFDPRVNLNYKINRSSVINHVNNWVNLRIDIPLDFGLHYWEVQIDTAIKGNFAMGMVTGKQRDELDTTGVVVLYSGHIYIEEKEHAASGVRTTMQKGDIIGALVEVDVKQVSFFLNGNYFTTAKYDHLPKVPYYPGLSVSGTGASLHYHNLLDPFQVLNSIKSKSFVN